MPLWVHCSHCDQHYQFPDAAAGKQAACPRCGQVLKVSAAAPAPMPIPPAPRMPQPQRIPAAPDLPPPPRPEEPMWVLPVEPDHRRRPPHPDDRRPPRARPIDDRRPPAPAPAPPRPAPTPETLSQDLPAVAGDNPTAYHHPACGGVTPLPPDGAARITGDPFGFTPGVYCSTCRRYVGLRTVVWQGTRETLAAYRAAVFADNAPRQDSDAPSRRPLDRRRGRRRPRRPFQHQRRGCSASWRASCSVCPSDALSPESRFRSDGRSRGRSRKRRWPKAREHIPDQPEAPARDFVETLAGASGW